jgi:hypothetical protein
MASCGVAIKPAGDGIARPVDDPNILFSDRRANREVLGRHDCLASSRPRVEEWLGLASQIAQR